jgi:MFS transporter, UMF1 family
MSPPPGRLSVVSWITYDLANTIFALGVGGLYFATWLTQNGWPDAALSVALAAAMVVVIVLSPWIGMVGDHVGRRVPLLIPTTLLAVTATFFLATFPVGPSLVLFSLALIGFNLGGVIYDSLLPDVSTEENRGRISGWGIGIGYGGSVIAVLIGRLLLDSHGFAVVFRSIAVLFLVFSLPAFLFIRERPRTPLPGPPPGITSSVRHLVAAWRAAACYRGVVPFLVGRFFYTDAINTLIGGFLAIFVIQELDFTESEVQILLALAIVTAIIGGIGSGPLIDRFGPRRQLHTALYGWMVTMLGGIVAAVTHTPWVAWPVAALGGISLGSTWAADRVYMARIAPPRRLGEFYGLYATVGRFATVLGPLVWAIIVNLLHWPRSAAMAALIGFLVTARIILRRVDDTPREWQTEDLVEAGG